jgi:membrane fusion protein, macrolide-specific efflux system
MSKQQWKFILGRRWVWTGGVLAAALFLTAAVHGRGKEVVHQPKVGRVIEGIYGLGTVNADQVFTAKTGVSLQLQALPVKEGDKVKAGDLLARFDESALRAPFEGTVTQIAFKPGEIVPPQAPVLTLTNLSRLYLEVNLEQQSVLKVGPGKKAAVSFESLRGERFEGAVKYIYPRDSQFIVRIELETWPEGVLPGMTADVAIEALAREEALLIPLKAVEEGKVVLMRDGARKETEVTLGAVSGEWAEVLAGDINLSDRLVMNRR